MPSLFDTGIRPAVDDWLLKKAAEKRDYGSYWSASSAGYCHRKLIFERLGVPYVVKDDDARKQRLFTAGHLFHQWMQGITKEAGLSIAQEVELQDEDLKVRGHFDDLVLVEDRLILYDFKTRNSKNFDYAKRPSHYHKMQLGTYMYMLRQKPIPAKPTVYGEAGEIHFKPIDATSLTEARTLNISKDDLRMVEVQYPYSDSVEKEVLAYWTDLNASWGLYEAQGTLPDCTCADHENGFLAKQAWNPYWSDGQPCSIKLLEEWKNGQTSSQG